MGAICSKKKEETGDSKEFIKPVAAIPKKGDSEVRASDVSLMAADNETKRHHHVKEPKIDDLDTIATPVRNQPRKFSDADLVDGGEDDHENPFCAMLSKILNVATDIKLSGKALAQITDKDFCLNLLQAEADLERPISDYTTKIV
jgi:hypothetical protein